MHKIVISRKAVASPVSETSEITFDTSDDSITRSIGSGGSPSPNQEHAPSVHSAWDVKRSNDDKDSPLPHVQHGSSTAYGYSRVANSQPELELTRGETTRISAVENQSHMRRRGRLILQLGAWWPEAGCCVLAFALLVGLIVFLRHYDRKPGPDSLNTIVAIIATICKAIMAIPITEGLSQLKWNSFARTQGPLGDLYTFDQASRGPLGSLMLLLKTQGRQVFKYSGGGVPLTLVC